MDHYIGSHIQINIDNHSLQIRPLLPDQLETNRHGPHLHHPRSPLPQFKLHIRLIDKGAKLRPNILNIELALPERDLSMLPGDSIIKDMYLIPIQPPYMHSPIFRYGDINRHFLHLSACTFQSHTNKRFFIIHKVEQCVYLIICLDDPGKLCMT